MKLLQTLPLNDPAAALDLLEGMQLKQADYPRIEVTRKTTAILPAQAQLAIA